MGARSDIAQAAAHEFARNGSDIILAAQYVETLAATKSDLEIRYNTTVYLADFDAAQFESHPQFYADLPANPNIVLYAIGYLGDQKLSETDWKEAKTAITANFTGAVSILSIIANDFESQKQGTIIGISSVAGERGRQSNYVYGSAKSGLTAFLAGLRHRLASSGVKVITVKPGFVRTKMTAAMDLPKLLTASPEGLASAIFKAYKKGSSVVYFLPIWRLIMFIIRNVPEWVFVRTKL